MHTQYENTADQKPDSFFRSPRWRWLRATYLHQDHRPADPETDDEWVDRALRHLASDEKPDPSVQAAVALSDEGSLRRRDILEARLLTDEPLDVISQKCDLAEETVTAYSKLFFDVRAHLHAGDWIVCRAIGTTYWHGFSGLPLSAAWKYFAYTSGPLTLDLIIAATMDQPFPAWLRAWFVADEDYHEKRLRLMIKLIVAAMTTNSPEEMKALIEMREELRHLDSNFKNEAPDREGMMPAIEQFLTALPRSVQATRDTATTKRMVRKTPSRQQAPSMPFSKKLVAKLLKST